ncbi:MAG: TatD family hydrolase [Lachnospiraceae bacterium]|nr:TatD family hydrolase [Lachnospiraceae bacterium]
MFVDTHIHMSHKKYDNEFSYIGTDENENFDIKRSTRADIIEEIKKGGIEFCVEPGIDINSNGVLIELSEQYPEFLYPAVGVHPTRSVGTDWKDRAIIEELSCMKNVVAIGELGLDYHEERKKQHRMKQKRWFVWQLKLAYRRKLPLVLHIRQADKDAIHILRRYRRKINGGVCHCFSGDKEKARIYTEEFGLMLGIGGALLWNSESGKMLEDAVKNTPLEYIVLETDGPYVRPQKPEEIARKRWIKANNTSLIIPQIAKKIADLKGISVEEVEIITSENAKRLFNIKR